MFSDYRQASCFTRFLTLTYRPGTLRPQRQSVSNLSGLFFPPPPPAPLPPLPRPHSRGGGAECGAMARNVCRSAALAACQLATGGSSRVSPAALNTATERVAAACAAAEAETAGPDHDEASRRLLHHVAALCAATTAAASGLLLPFSRQPVVACDAKPASSTESATEAAGPGEGALSCWTAAPLCASPRAAPAAPRVGHALPETVHWLRMPSAATV